jgi:tetratricopeptide (TPR) repeat protein
VTNYPGYFNLEEAHFVMGQCYLKLGYYDFAVKEYNEITKKGPKLTDYAAKHEQSSQELVIQEKLLQELNSELLVLESRLLLERSLTTSNGSIDFISVDQKEMKEKSQALYETLAKERRNFETLSNSLLNLKKQIDKDQINRNWRAYADYGKARALFLISVPQ